MNDGVRTSSSPIRPGAIGHRDEVRTTRRLLLAVALLPLAAMAQ